MRLDVTTLRQVSPLLDEAMDLEGAQREAWFARLERTNPAMATILRNLLKNKASVETNDLLERGPEFTPPIQARPTGDFKPGDAVGSYRLIRELGVGGMGEVWLAERADGALKRQVALKLPMISLKRSVLLQRFERERDILASLTHPNIARLYDAGFTETGQPYLALEYVNGQPITQYAESSKLDTRAKIGLLLEVMHAVQYAHTNLVIHRDIKPDNVLVSSDGKVHLLDFGISKLLEDDVSQAYETELTRLGGRALTLSYAAPEQITGSPVSTGTDVYALGVLLYELLTRGRPFKGTKHEIENAILNTVPLRTKGLAEDLENVMLKALKKSASERYSTVSEFANDLVNWLQGKPVSAQPDKLSYRIHKFVQRHRWSMSLGALAIVALVAITGVAVAMGLKAREEAVRAIAARDFMIDLFSEADSDLSHGKQRTAVELLDIGRTRIMESLNRQPLLQADLLYGLAVAQNERSETVKADTTMAQAAMLYEAAGHNNEAAAALIHQARTVLRNRDVKRSKSLLARAASLLERDGNDAQWARYYEVMAVLSYSEGHSARAYAERALALAKSAKVKDLSLMMDVLSTMASIESKSGHYQTALAYLEEANASADQSSRLPLHIQIDMSKVEISAGRYDAAAHRLKTTLARCEQTLDSRGDTCSVVRSRLAVVLIKLGSYPEALTLLPDLYPMSGSIDSPGTGAIVQLRIGRVLASVPRPDKHLAIWSQLQALANSGEEITVGESLKISALHVLATMRLQGGEPMVALQLLQSAQKRIDAISKTDGCNCNRNRSQNNLLRGLALHALGQYGAALQALRDSNKLSSEEFGAEHPATLLESVNQARTLWAMDRTPEALALLDHALPVVGPALGIDSPSYLRMVKLHKLLIHSPAPDSRMAKLVDIFSDAIYW